ncbi:MAG: COG3014 family protein [Spirochaetaceae bacterium]
MIKRLAYKGAPLLFFAITLFFFGCTTYNHPFVEVDEQARSGNYGAAAQKLAGEDRSDFYSEKEKVLYYLDLGMLYHYDGQWQSSSEHFEEAEMLIEEYFTKSISQAATSLLLNDTAMDYAGEDYEDIYLNVFKAINYIKEDQFDGAFVEIRRVNNKLNLLEDKYKDLAEEYGSSEEAEIDIETGESRFYSSALARYLSMLVYRADGNWDSARIDYQGMQEAFARQSNIYDFPLPLGEEVIEKPEGAKLSLLAFAGESPVKRATTFRIATYNNRLEISTEGETDMGQMQLASYNTIYWPGMEGGYRFKFQLPRMVSRGSEVRSIRVLVDGSPVGELKKIESIQKVAQETFSVKLPVIYFKTISRTVIKGLVAQKGKEKMREAGSSSGSAFGLAAGIVGSIATDVALEASEKADVRTSRYFPAFAYVGEWDVPEGTHRVQVEFYGRNNLLATRDLGEIDVRAGEANLLTAYYPK